MQERIAMPMARIAWRESRRPLFFAFLSRLDKSKAALTRTPRPVPIISPIPRLVRKAVAATMSEKSPVARPTGTIR